MLCKYIRYWRSSHQIASHFSRSFCAALSGTPHVSPETPDNLAKTKEIFNKLQNESVLDQELSRTLNMSNCAAIIRHLVSRDVDDQLILKTLKAQPSSTKFQTSAWSSILEVMIANGITLDTCLEIIAQVPEVLQFKDDHLMQNFDQLRSFGYGEQFMQLMIKVMPSVLISDVRQIQNRIEILKATFRKADIETLIKLSPNILIDDWYEIEMKIHYVIFKMGLDQRHIVRTGVLKYDLEHIKLRHQFLVKTGIYKFQPKNIDEFVKSNPRLGQIMNSSESEFIRKIAPNLSMEEYLAFKEFIKFDNINDSDNEFDDDSDSD